MASTNVQFDLSQSLVALQTSAEFNTFLAANRGFLDLFGKKNSHLLRNKLERLMTANNLTADAKFAVYMLCSAMRRKDRIMQGIEDLPQPVRSLQWMQAVRTFINARMCTWPKDEGATTFATIHVASANPPFAMYSYGKVWRYEDLTLENLVKEQVFGQLHLSEGVQKVHKMAMIIFWCRTVSRTTRTDTDFNSRAGSLSAFDNTIYRNQIADRYVLINEDKTARAPGADGYSWQDIIDWLNTFRPADNQYEATLFPTVESIGAGMPQEWIVAANGDL